MCLGNKNKHVEGVKGLCCRISMETSAWGLGFNHTTVGGLGFNRVKGLSLTIQSSWIREMKGSSWPTLKDITIISTHL